MLSNSVCIKPEDDYLYTTRPTTLLTTLAKFETTIITTVPKVDTTIPQIITTLPKNDLTTFITTITETTFQQKNTIKTTNYETSIVTTIQKESDNLQSTDNFTELFCDDNINKIMYKGKCICNIRKGYYSINYGVMNNICYTKENLPKKYIYFNNESQMYELCYKTCETCDKGGNETINNCLTCDNDYIKDPINNSSCIKKCKYYYYYNSLKQHSCTDNAQCPKEASLLVRSKNKCVNRCSNDETNKFQYNGECFAACPNNTKVPNNTNTNICQINDIKSCSSNDFALNLDNTINQNNVKLAAKIYANEFEYTINHISRFLSENFTMVLYKNNSCINELNLNITSIEYDSCINQLKIDYNIGENNEIIVAVIDIVNDNKRLTTLGFFDSDSGEKLDASKSCSDKNVIMYENIWNVLTEPLSLKLLKEQNINILDLESEFYNDICFHFDSPNGRDATLQDRIKVFYPNVTLCSAGCKNKGINITSMKVECECIFQDLLSNSLLDNDLVGDNVIIKGFFAELREMIGNLNLEILACYKDVFDINYFKKNIGGFIILSLIFIQTICFFYFYLVSYNKLTAYISYLIEISLLLKNKNLSGRFNIPFNPLKKKRKKKAVINN